MAAGIVACPYCNSIIDSNIVRITKPKLLIVEGRDEEIFIGNMLKKLNIRDIQVAGIGGKEKIKPRLKALKIEPNFSIISSLAILRDADSNPESAFKSVQKALKDIDMPCPKEPLTPAKGFPVVRIMIIPSYTQKGALEDLCLNSVSTYPAMTCVEQFFECIKQQGLAGPKKTEISKAKIRVFLSSHKDPTLPLGIAAEKGYWPFEHETFNEIKRFLKSL